MPTDRPYVTNEAWQHHPSRRGRADAIDEIADQFERPSGADEFWSRAGGSVVRLDEWTSRRVGPRAHDEVERLPRTAD